MAESYGSMKIDESTTVDEICNVLSKQIEELNGRGFFRTPAAYEHAKENARKNAQTMWDTVQESFAAVAAAKKKTLN